MPKPKIIYFPDEDVLHLAITDEPEAASIELSANVTAELNARHEVIGVEVLDASEFMRDTIFDVFRSQLGQLEMSTPT